jgi:hypothetical protein
MRQYAGEHLVGGDQVQTWANHYIAVHLRRIGGGKTYWQVSALSIADPKNRTLRGLLLNSWGWWNVGSSAFYAAIGMTLARHTGRGWG